MEHIRRVKPDDAQCIALLGRVTFAESFGHLFDDRDDLKNYLDSTFSVKKIEASIQKPNNRYWIAFVDALPVGYTKLKLVSPSEFMEEGTVSQLQKIYVLQDFLSMKIGKRLQELVLSDARQAGSRAIWLSVWKGNARAIGFYTKHAFQAIGAHTFRIGKQSFDFTVMSRLL